MSGLLGRLRDGWRRVAARRGDLVGINGRNVGLVYPHNPRREYPIADDKLLAKEWLSRGGVPVARTLAVCEGLFGVAGLVDGLAGRAQLAIKPARGSGGAGIVVLGELVADGVWRRAGGALFTAAEARRHVADIVFGAFSNQLADRAFVEERIAPHPLFREMWADGLCDIRVITLRATPVLAMVRVPTARSGGRANLHQGGLGLAVDLATGRTVRAYSAGRAIARHPETGRALLGVTLPGWDRILEVARQAARAVPLGYLGTDIVVDEAGSPLVLEINVRPGLEIQNVHGVALGAALTRAGLRA